MSAHWITVPTRRDGTVRSPASLFVHDHHLCSRGFTASTQLRFICVQEFYIVRSDHDRAESRNARSSAQGQTDKSLDERGHDRAQGKRGDWMPCNTQLFIDTRTPGTALPLG